jgi:hypothetical protein
MEMTAMGEIKLSDEYLAQQREVKSVRKDIETARGIISDALLRYKKKMLHARSKKQAEDLSVFAELDPYGSKLDIQDAYGYASISDRQMDRLNDLWDARENFINEQGQFEDRVSEMLKRARDGVGEEFLDMLFESDMAERRIKEDIARINRENSENDYNRYIAGLRGNGDASDG